MRLGDLDVALHRGAKGETDDALWVWVPAAPLSVHRRPRSSGRRRTAATRRRCSAIPSEWADALETMAGLDAEWLFPGHGLVVHGRDAVRTVLTETARYLRVHHRPGARTHERRPDAGGDLPRRRARSGAGRRAPICGRPTTTRSSSCATCCASGAGGGTATPPTCCRRRGARRRREIARSRAASRRWSRAVARCSTAATPAWPPTSPSGRRAPRPTTAPRRRSSATSTSAGWRRSRRSWRRGIYRAAMNDARKFLGEPLAPGADGLMSFTAARR